MKTLISICTYNESENIENAVSTLLKMYGDGYDILVVDDLSPDGTGERVKEMMIDSPRLSLMSRDGPRGRGCASKAGYEFFLNGDYDHMVEIDADLSHPPTAIAEMVKFRNSYDMIIGSRFVRGGGFGNYPFHRVALSHITNCVFKRLLSLPYRDSTQSFVLMSRKIFENISPGILQSPGFSIFLELKYHIKNHGFTCHEIPIVIRDRDKGKSKMGIWQFASILKMIFVLRFQKRGQS